MVWFRPEAGVKFKEPSGAAAWMEWRSHEAARCDSSLIGDDQEEWKKNEERMIPVPWSLLEMFKEHGHVMISMDPAVSQEAMPSSGDSALYLILAAAGLTASSCFRLRLDCFHDVRERLRLYKEASRWSETEHYRSLGSANPDIQPAVDFCRKC